MRTTLDSTFLHTFYHRPYHSMFCFAKRRVYLATNYKNTDIVNILIAPDSFKGSLSAAKATEAIRKGIFAIHPDCTIHALPLSDGGEGITQTLYSTQKGCLRTLKAHDPLMRLVEVEYLILEPQKCAVIEMAQASGLLRLTPEEYNPLITTTFGTGELIKDALDQGCRTFIIGVGGSATHDGGAGMAQALGIQLLDNQKKEISFGGGSLAQIKHIDLSSRDPRIAKSKFYGACDVLNPLTGKNGASTVYAPQKGATPEMVLTLENSLVQFAACIKRELNIDLISTPRAGAAGGLGAGIIAFLNGTLKSGIELVFEALDFEKWTNWADIIITGEGSIDSQSLEGKCTFGVAQIAKKYNKPLLIFAGKSDSDRRLNTYFQSITIINDDYSDQENPMQQAAIRLEQSVARVLKKQLVNPII